MPKSLSSFAAPLLLGGALCVCGCSKKMPRTYLPPPLPPQNAKVILPPAYVEAPVEDQLVAKVELPVVTLDLPTFPEAPKPAVRPRPPASAPKPAASVVAQPENPALPRITQMFTTEEYRAYTKDLDETLSRVSRALEMLSKKNLTAEEKDKEEQITTFQKQAEKAREQDLVNAVNLARRADLLAKDLLERLP